jgi:putative membrane protein
VTEPSDRVRDDTVDADAADDGSVTSTPGEATSGEAAPAETASGRTTSGEAVDAAGADERATDTAGDAPSAPEPVPLDEIIAERPVEALSPMRSPLALFGTVLVGGAMGAAELVPGFSGGTVAFVAGIYERLVASIRQGARTLSLLIRGRPQHAWQAVQAIDWPFVAALALGMITALLTLATALTTLLDERPVEMQAIFFGLILGAAVLAARQIREPNAWLILLVVVSAFGFFVLFGITAGEQTDPNGLWLILGGALAISAWILPGVSGSFVLLVLGLYTTVIGAVADRDVLTLAIFAVGCVIGLAAFSTALNWLLARAHDIVLAVLIGLMAASARVLWPWPSDGGLGNPELGAPEGSTAFLATALALAAFGLTWMFGLFATAIEIRRDRWRDKRAARDAERSER